MAYTGHFGQSDDYRREELIRKIEHSLQGLTLAELEALYYDMSTKNYINEWSKSTVIYMVQQYEHTLEGADDMPCACKIYA